MERNKIADPSLFKIDKKESAVETVIDKIKDLLLSKKLLPGDKLPNEFTLAEKIEISRGTVREAMKILSAFGIVDIRRGDGTYISTMEKNIAFDPLLFNLIINYNSFDQLFELRESMEVMIIKLIIKNAGAEELKGIEKALSAMKERSLKKRKEDYKTMVQYDINFHIALGKATKNVLVEKIYSFILDLFKDSIEATHKNQDHAREAITIHENIYNSLIEKDPGKALQAIKKAVVAWRDLSGTKDRSSYKSKESKSVSMEYL